MDYSGTAIISSREKKMLTEFPTLPGEEDSPSISATKIAKRIKKRLAKLQKDEALRKSAIKKDRLLINLSLTCLDSESFNELSDELFKDSDFVDRFNEIKQNYRYFCLDISFNSICIKSFKNIVKWATLTDNIFIDIVGAPRLSKKYITLLCEAVFNEFGSCSIMNKIIFLPPKYLYHAENHVPLYKELVEKEWLPKDWAYHHRIYYDIMDKSDKLKEIFFDRDPDLDISVKDVISKHIERIRVPDSFGLNVVTIEHKKEYDSLLNDCPWLKNEDRPPNIAVDKFVEKIYQNIYFFDTYDILVLDLSQVYFDQHVFTKFTDMVLSDGSKLIKKLKDQNRSYFAIDLSFSGVDENNWSDFVKWIKITDCKYIKVDGCYPINENNISRLCDKCFQTFGNCDIMERFIFFGEYVLDGFIQEIEPTCSQLVKRGFLPENWIEIHRRYYKDIKDDDPFSFNEFNE